MPELLSDSSFAMPAGHARWVRFGPGGDGLYSGGGPEIHVWDARSLRLVRTLPAGCERIGRASLHPQGRHLAAGGADGSLRVWELTSGQCVRTLLVSASAIEECCYLPNGWIAFGGSDGTVRWLDPTHPEAGIGEHRLSRRKHDPLHSLAAAGDRLAALHQAGAQVWTTAGEELLRVRGAYDHGQDSPAAILLSPKGDTACIAFRGLKQVSAWSLPAPDRRPAWTCPLGAPAYALALSPDGTRLAVGLWGEAALLALPEGRLTARWVVESGHPRYASAVWDLAFSPDGTRLAAATPDTGRLHLWRLPE